MQTTRTKSKTSENSKQKRTQFNRFVNNRIDKSKNKSRINRKSRKNAPYINFLRTNNLKPLSSIKVDLILKQGIFSEEQNVVKVIKDIYPFIKKDISILLHTKNFAENTEPIDFLSWMIESYDTVKEFDDWDIIRNENGNYYLKSVVDYNMDDRGYSAQLKFLEVVQRENEKLFDLFIGMFGLFYKELKSPFYFNCSDFEQALDCAEDDLTHCLESDMNEEEREWCIQELDYYNNGNPHIFGEYIKHSEMTLEQFKVKLKRFKPKTELDKLADTFFEKALKLFNYNNKFSDFIHLNNEEDDQCPIMPFQYVMFGWNYDEDESKVAWFVEQNLQMNWQEYGSIPFRTEIINNEDKELSMFPYDYLDMMDSIFEIERLAKRL